jgi:hypothetical protein
MLIANKKIQKLQEMTATSNIKNMFSVGQTAVALAYNKPRGQQAQTQLDKLVRIKTGDSRNKEQDEKAEKEVAKEAVVLPCKSLNTHDANVLLRSMMRTEDGKKYDGWTGKIFNYRGPAGDFNSSRGWYKYEKNMGDMTGVVARETERPAVKTVPPRTGIEGLGERLRYLMATQRQGQVNVGGSLKQKRGTAIVDVGAYVIRAKTMYYTMYPAGSKKETTTPGEIYYFGGRGTLTNKDEGYAYVDPVESYVQVKGAGVYAYLMGMMMCDALIW